MLARVKDTLTLARAKYGHNWTAVTTSSHGVSHAGLTHLALPDGTGAFFRTDLNVDSGHLNTDSVATLPPAYRAGSLPGSLTSSTPSGSVRLFGSVLQPQTTMVSDPRR